MYIIIFIFFAINLVTIGYPIVSIQEIQQLPNFILLLLPPNYLPIIRLFSLLSVIFFIISALSKLKNKKQLILFVLLTSPLLLILAKEFNILVIFVLIISSIWLLSNNNYFLLFASFLYIFFIYLNHSFNSIIFQQLWVLIKSTCNLTGLFFQNETVHKYIRIPKNGYFLESSLIFFLYGIYHLIKEKKSITIKYLLFLLFGLIIFLTYPSKYFIFSGIGLLIFILIIISYGSVKIKMNKFFVGLLLFVTVLNFAFFLESYFRHYQKKYSQERGYAKFQLMEKIKLIDKIVEITQDSDIDKLYQYYSYHYSMPKIRKISNGVWSINDCFNNKQLICALTEKEIEVNNQNKNDSRFYIVTNDNGGRAYFLTNVKQYEN